MQSKQKKDAPAIGQENVKQLKKALKECREQLAHAEAMLRAATAQDNQPE